MENFLQHAEQKILKCVFIRWGMYRIYGFRLENFWGVPRGPRTPIIVCQVRYFLGPPFGIYPGGRGPGRPGPGRKRPGPGREEAGRSPDGDARRAPWRELKMKINNWGAAEVRTMFPTASWTLLE